MSLVAGMSNAAAKLAHRLDRAAKLDVARKRSSAYKRKRALQRSERLRWEQSGDSTHSYFYMEGADAAKRPPKTDTGLTFHCSRCNKAYKLMYWKNKHEQECKK